MESTKFKCALFLEIYRDKPEWSIDHITSKVNDIYNHLKDGFKSYDFDSPTLDEDEEKKIDELEEKVKELNQFKETDTEDYGDYSPTQGLAIYLQNNQTAYAAFETRFRDILFEAMDEHKMFAVHGALKQDAEEACVEFASKLLQTFIEENTE